MDNLTNHKVTGVRDSIEATSTQLLYLPPYSPNFNPIKKVFAKLKASLHCAFERSIQVSWKKLTLSFTPPFHENVLITWPILVMFQLSGNCTSRCFS